MNEAIEILLLAAGRSSRTGRFHKLLATFDGEPLVRRSARVALGATAARVSVVLGARAAEMAAALEGLPLELRHNPDHAEGLSTSLKLGFSGLREMTLGVVIMLADQPFLEAGHLDRLIAAFRPSGRGSIVVATDRGKRFNPVLIGTLYRDEVARLHGDVGAKSLLAAHAPLVIEVEIGRAASFDVDTPDALALAGGRPPGAN
ncbi:hypothetical protein GCM10011390_06990 [Aureimonas endophytica]|uniref:MobA-like NTP transferase domain-containing protein n=1 Tax=Aureimonas endophytica TaxID=2027858 RepID=A0A917E174_9HYPH|nr:hypothetical protein GCM10011390_06990 [Aureimonas endophytica]